MSRSSCQNGLNQSLFGFDMIFDEVEPHDGHVIDSGHSWILNICSDTCLHELHWNSYIGIS